MRECPEPSSRCELLSLSIEVVPLERTGVLVSAVPVGAVSADVGAVPYPTKSTTFATLCIEVPDPR